MVKVLYKPLGIICGVIGGMLAGALFKQIWKQVDAEQEAPGPTERDYPWSKVLLAAGLQGAIYSVVKAAVDRSGAEGFQWVTGIWPGESRQEEQRKQAEKDAKKAAKSAKKSQRPSARAA